MKGKPSLKSFAHHSALAVLVGYAGVSTGIMYVIATGRPVLLIEPNIPLAMFEVVVLAYATLYGAGMLLKSVKQTFIDSRKTEGV